METGYTESSNRAIGSSGHRALFLCVLCVLCGKSAFAQIPSQPGSTDYTATSLRFLLQNPPVQPTQISASRLDNPGPCTYHYWVVSKFPIGNAQPSGPASVPNASCTLTNGNRIGWESVTGATSYDVLRTTTAQVPSGACACAVATAVSGNSVTDTGTLSAYTVNTFTADVRFLEVNVQCSAGLAGIELIADGNTTPALTVTSDGLLHQGNCTGPVITGGTVPGAPVNSIQFNNSGSFGGITPWLWNSGSDEVVTVDPAFSLVFGLLTSSFTTIKEGGIAVFTSGGSPANLDSDTGPGNLVSAPGSIISGTSPGDGQAKRNITAAVVTAGPNAADSAQSVIGTDYVPANPANVQQAFAMTCESGWGLATTNGGCLHIKDQGTRGNVIQVDGGMTTITGLSGGFRLITSNSNLTVNDFVVDCDATVSSVSLTGLAAPPPGMLLGFKKQDSSANTCTFNGNGNPIDGNTTLVLSQQNQAAILAYDAVHSVWKILGQAVNNSSVTVNTVTCSIGGSCTLTTAPSGWTVTGTMNTQILQVTGSVKNSTGFQSFSFSSCTTLGVLNNACGTTITWPVAFPDANYKVNCSINAILTGGAVTITGTGTRSTTQAVIEIQNIGTNAVASQVSIDCSAWESSS